MKKADGEQMCINLFLVGGNTCDVYLNLSAMVAIFLCIYIISLWNKSIWGILHTIVKHNLTYFQKIFRITKHITM